VEAGGRPVTAAFEVSLPPEIFVMDQPDAAGRIVVERIISEGPGWLVAYAEQNGSPAQIIGWAPLQDGLNEQILLAMEPQAVTPRLFLMIHDDTGDPGEFGFPATDPPRSYRDRVIEPISMRTDMGDFVITHDQRLTASGRVIVDLAVSDQDFWLVIQSDRNGQPDQIIGQLWAAAGYNRNVAIEIDPLGATSVLYVTLHQDLGTAREFDYPDGPDTPMTRSRSIIRAPFNLAMDEEPD
jgi:hypothetical protein